MVMIIQVFSCVYSLNVELLIAAPHGRNCFVKTVYFPQTFDKASSENRVKSWSFVKTFLEEQINREQTTLSYTPLPAINRAFNVIPNSLLRALET